MKCVSTPGWMKCNRMLEPSSSILSPFYLYSNLARVACEGHLEPKNYFKIYKVSICFYYYFSNRKKYNQKLNVFAVKNMCLIHRATRNKDCLFQDKENRKIIMGMTYFLLFATMQRNTFNFTMCVLRIMLQFSLWWKGIYHIILSIICIWIKCTCH
jgi:hypothetical protein